VSLASILLMLAMHKDIQKKVIDEIDTVLMQDGLITDYESAYKLTYLETVIKETMRLFPILPLVARETTDEIELDGYVIPEGTIINIFSFGVQRNKKYWGEDAHLFKPSRFEPENIRNVHQYAYIPFTGGQRMCIGWRYAMIFMKVYLANFFRHYTVDTHLKFDEITLTFAPSIMFNQKHMISIAKRKTN
jgi:cytochrome P450